MQEKTQDLIRAIGIAFAVFLLLILYIVPSVSTTGSGIRVIPQSQVGPNVQFNETGLPSGTNWSGTASGKAPSGAPETITWTTNATTQVTGPWTNTPPPEVNFTIYAVKVGSTIYDPTPSTGTVYTVSTLYNVYYQNITYKAMPKAYQDILTVEVAGLPAKTLFTTYSWSAYFTNNATINQTIFSSAHTVQFIIINGTYFFHFSPVQLPYNVSYVPFPAQGYFTVYGANYTLFVQYYNNTPGAIYSVTFEPLGLASGTLWTLGINGSMFQSTGNIVLMLPAGLQSLTASSSGHAYNGSSTVLIFENKQIVHIDFVNVTYTQSGQDLNIILSGIGLTIPTFYSILMTLAATIVGVVILMRTDNLLMGGSVATGLLWAGWLFSVVQMWLPMVVMSFVIGAVVLKNIERDGL